MEIERLIVGPLRTNCYILSEVDDCIIIDPGGDTSYIVDFLKSRNLTPTMILATHGHFDHILSVSDLKIRFNIPFFISRKDMRIAESFTIQTRTYAGYDPGPSPVPDNFLSNGDTFKVGNKKLKVVDTPGHTPGSCSFLIDWSFFSGDFIFSGSVGRTDFGGSMDEMLLSLKWAKALKDDFDIYPGHGRFSTLEAEKKSNPFFRENFLKE